MEYATTATLQRAARAYGQVGITSGVDTADPHKLILMLFDGAIEAIARARMHLAAGQVAAKGQAISQAVLIVEQGLNASLDRQSGGPLAQTLTDLYDYIARRLLIANAGNDVGGFDEASRLLGELRAAWAAMRGNGAAP
jgi:flagellar protein FliS